MGFEMSIPVLTVFAQGLISFLSPCVLPLLPLYIGYLSGGTMTKNENGELAYDRKKVMVNTLFFVIGISFAFFVLGFGVSSLGQFFKSNQNILAKAGGVIIVLFGVYQLGFLGTSKTIATEHRIQFSFDKFAMSPWVALLMGFTFSFAWTPCVGPILAGVLMMTASTASQTAGFLLIGVYTLGFVIPFLAVGFFTTSILALFKKYRNVVKYTVKIGGILLIVMGVMIFSGKMTTITSYLNSVSAGTQTEQTEKTESKSEKTENKPEKPEKKQEKTDRSPSIDFTLKDQNGNEHTLSDYKGKTVMLNFWATWCGYCVQEMPDIQKIYEDFGENSEDLIILGVAAPDYGGEKSAEEIAEFLSEKGFTYPNLMDTTGEIFYNYGVMSYPTTFIIDKNGDVAKYANGALSEDILRDAINEVMEE